MHENNGAQSEDFVSIGTIKNAILDFFRSIFHLFDFIFTSVRMNIVLLCLSCILGMLVAFLIYELKPRYYESEMLVINNILGRREYYNMVSNLNGQVASLNYTEFAHALGIKIADARNINSLEVDTSAVPGEPFIINVRLLNGILPPAFDDKLLNYLNNGSPYLAQVQVGELQIANGRLAFIDEEQRKLDSLKVLYNRSLDKMQSPSTFYNNAINPAEIYLRSNSLVYQKDSILRWLNSRSKPLMLIDGFKKPTTLNKFSLKTMLVLGLLGGAGLGIIIILLATIRRMLLLRSDK